MRDWAEAWGLADVPAGVGRDRAYLAAAIAAGRGNTPLFGMRVQQPHLPMLCATLRRLFPGRASDRSRMEQAFGPLAFVHLSRGDMLAQAVSLVRARQTGLWHVDADGRELERTGPPHTPAYDRAAIRAALSGLDRADRGWRRWFDRQRIVPHRLTYEALARNPAVALAGVCVAIGVEPPAAHEVRPGLARLADATSRDWARRYLADDAIALASRSR